MPANLENSAVATGLERSVFIPIPKKGNSKECSNYCTIAFISHPSKVMLKILQARLQQYVNRELLDVQAGFRKDGGARNQIANIRWIIEKSTVPEKHLFLLYWLRQSLWLCGSQQTGKFLKRWEYQITRPASWEICMQVKKQQLELVMVQHARGQREELCPWHRSWGRRHGTRTGVIKPQETPCSRASSPKPESVSCSHLHLWLYGGSPP